MPNKSLWLTIAGFAGFFLAITCLFGPCGMNKSAFHEVVYNPGVIARDMLTGKKDTLVARLRTLDSLKKKLPRRQDEKIKKQRQGMVQEIADYSVLLHQVDSSYFVVHNDTSRWQKAHEALRADIDLDTLFSLEDNYVKHPDASAVPVNFEFEITDAKNEEIRKTVALPIKAAFRDIDFFSQYPAFGIWALMIILFVTCLLMTLVYCVDAFGRLTVLANLTGCRQRGTIPISLFISAVLMVTFTGSIMSTLYDSDGIKNLYFMSDLSSKVRVISIGGYLVAALCFAGMIAVASYAKCFSKKIPPETEEQKLIRKEIKEIEDSADADKNKKMEEKKEELRLNRLQSTDALQKRMAEEIEKLQNSLQTEADPQKKGAIETQLSAKKEESRLYALRLAAVVEDYANLRKLFRRFFYAISLLLALLVFSTGALYSAVDSLSFMQLIKKSLGFASARPDFVYLYGALHTVLILLFYLPARLQLSMYLPGTGSESSEEENKSFLKTLSTPIKKLPDVLVATAPLLASLVQWVLSAVFGE